MNRLDYDFYKNSCLEVAPKLLGKFLCRNIEGQVLKYRITETESYYGESDTACHAHKGKTNRTKVIYNQGGIVYIYLCYGIHNLLNVVTGEMDFPECVLIRGIENFNGPGKLTKVLKIDRTLNEENLITSNKLWIEEDDFNCEYKTSKRVGIDYATEEYKNKLWRFIMI